MTSPGCYGGDFGGLRAFSVCNYKTLLMSYLKSITKAALAQCLLAVENLKKHMPVHTNICTFKKRGYHISIQ